MQTADNRYDFEGEVIAFTKKAILFRGEFWEGHEEGIWLSRKLNNVEIDPADPSCASVSIPGWLARKERLTDYE